MTNLFRYELALHEHQLETALTNPAAFRTVALNVSTSFDAFASHLTELIERDEDPASWDRALVTHLHRALKAKVDRRTTLDPRFWHWLTTQPLREFVWCRWYGEVPDTPEEVLSSALAERFLGAASLHGFSRNAVARLYWAGETLYSDADDYRLAVEALHNQDFFQAIFERKLGLYRPAAVACLKALKDYDEKGRRDAVKRLNHYLTTISAETLQVEELEAVLTETV